MRSSGLLPTSVTVCIPDYTIIYTDFVQFSLQLYESQFVPPYALIVNPFNGVATVVKKIFVSSHANRHT